MTSYARTFRNPRPKPTAAAVAARAAETLRRELRHEAREMLGLGKREDPEAEALIDAYVATREGQ